MTDTVKEYFIKSAFGNNWPIAAGILILSVAIFRFIYKCSLPEYFEFCVFTSIVAVTAFAESYFLQWDKYMGIYSSITPYLPVVSCTTIRIALLIIVASSLSILFIKCRKIDHQLELVMKNVKSDGYKIDNKNGNKTDNKICNSIAAWNELQKISVKKLTPWQKKKYDKRRLYLRVDLGNMAGAELECEKYKEDG